MVIPRSKRVLIRSMKAKLSILKRPMVWGSATVVLLASYVGFEYLTHPERLTFSGNEGEETRGTVQSPSNSPIGATAGDRPLPPPEDNGIGADIDSLSLLFSEIQAADVSADAEDGELSADTGANRDSSRGSLSFNTPYDLLTGDNVSNNAPETSSSFYSRLFSGSSPSRVGLAPSNFALQGSQVSGAESSFPAPSSGIPPRSPSPSPSVASSLQQSIRQRSNQSEQSGFGMALPNAEVSETTPLRSEPLNPEFASSPIYPGAVSSPYPGTTGYTSPAALRSPNNSYTRLTNPAFTNSGTTVAPATPNTVSPGVAVPQPAPYLSPPYRSHYPSSASGTTDPGATVPTQPYLPGTVTSPDRQPSSPSSSNSSRRYTGGGRNGEINTFSNP